MWQKIVGKTWRKMPAWGRRLIIRLTQPSFTVSAAVIILNQENCILLLNHVLRPASGWGIPGGFLKPGEQPMDSARREIFEETGLELDDLKLIKAHTQRRHVEILFVARSHGEANVKSREILEARWFEAEKLPPEMNQLQRAMIEQFMIKIREKPLI